jgi:hypothetical protein
MAKKRFGLVHFIALFFPDICVPSPLLFSSSTGVMSFSLSLFFLFVFWLAWNKEKGMGKQTKTERDKPKNQMQISLRGNRTNEKRKWEE